ncbi:hypothetical protein FJ420_02005 [Mesorhizobium sp. B3-1-3]|uniref:hypothetical protein n=1 Tax=unclassified Mesorhizobium TaxID=325217 RepID=UPI00112B4AEE|nr:MULTISPECIES: hypothetical protein [unclassified Mesorhizobium]TPI67604.1 hypothetical protein FJ424_09975 [Mesorhizobium sp. B3-1-8]TPI75650.1 hypothetical protein FJ420_02005 [Mesorhizobium sp. B3-1-3]
MAHIKAVSRVDLRAVLRNVLLSSTVALAPVVDPMTSFQYALDFVANTYKGGTQPYGSNTNDGRFFRDSGVVQACFIPKADGTLQSTSAQGMRRSDRGAIMYANIGTLGLWNRDLSNAVWTKDVGASALKNQTGADGTANAASSITFTADDARIYQATTAAVANRVLEVYIKRLTGPGPLNLSIDGTTYTDVTAQIGTTGYKRVLIATANVTNPVLTFKGKAGDSYAVDLVSCHGQIGGLDIPAEHYAIQLGTSFGTIFHETPWALNTDAGPLWSIIQGAYAFFWQGSSATSQSGNGLFVSDGVTNCQVGTGNTVTFGASVSLISGPDWKPGLGVTNKVAGWLDASGNMKLCVNGQTPVSRTGGILSPAATHFVLGSNGSGAKALNGIVEKFSIQANKTFTDAELIAMTT